MNPEVWSKKLTLLKCDVAIGLFCARLCSKAHQTQRKSSPRCNNSSHQIWQTARPLWTPSLGCWWPRTGSSRCQWCPGCECGGVIHMASAGKRPAVAPASPGRRSSASAQWAAGCPTRDTRDPPFGPERWWCCSWAPPVEWRGALEDRGIVEMRGKEMKEETRGR